MARRARLVLTRRTVLVSAVAIVALGAGSRASAQAECGGDAGARLAPNVCQLGVAAEEVSRAHSLRDAACTAMPRSAEARATCERTGDRARCEARDAVEAWNDAWARAAASTVEAWETRPLLHLDVLAEAQAARRARDAWARSCGVAAAPVPAWDAYLELARSTTSIEGLCDRLDDLVGPTWTGNRARWVLSPLRRALAPHCPDVGEALRASFERADRAREIAEEMLATVATLEAPTIADGRALTDSRVQRAMCARLPFFLGTSAAERAVGICGDLRRWPAPPSCDGARGCSLWVAVEGGAHGLARWASHLESADARGVVARALATAASRAEASSPVATFSSAELALTGRVRAARGACTRLGQASDAILRAPVEALTIDDVRVLLASARCRGTGAADERRVATIELARVREAAVHAPSVRRSPDAGSLVGVAGLLLLSTAGQQAAGREMVRPLLTETDLLARLSRTVAGGGPVDVEARRATAWISSRALGRLAEVAIDDGEHRLASDAITAMETVVEGAPIDGRERELQRVERGLLRVASALERDDERGARRATEDTIVLLAARGHGPRGYRRLEHEVRARAIELGLEPTPTGPARGCDADFVRRGLVRASRRADTAGERRALDVALRAATERGSAPRGPCTLARGFREAEVEAALARLRLRSQCVDDADRDCANDAEAAARAMGDALVAAVEAFERAVDDLRAEADVVRTRPLERLAEALRVEAERATVDERLAKLTRAGASRAAIDRLRWIAYSTPSCVAYPDVRVQLRWLAGRDVPPCSLLEAPPTDPQTPATVVFARQSLEDGAYVAWWRDGAALDRRSLGSARTIERDVDALVRALSDPTASYAYELETVVASLIAPFRARLRSLPRDAEVTVVPDSAVAALPFELLFAAAGRPDLRVRYALDVTPLPTEPVVPAGEPALVVADPRFGPSDGGGLARLPGTHAEAEAICGRYACEGRRFEREHATERALFGAAQELTGRWGVVHLATHAVFSGTDAVADRAAILLAGVGDDLPPTPLFSSENDGMLDEGELAALGLAYTRVVVLSACGTSRGRKRLGVSGLVRAARLSGARSVLGSLWSVDDAATSVWMQVFYRHLADGEGAATSARAAASVVRERWPHPYYWAPFVLVEARPTEELPEASRRRAREPDDD